MYLFKETLPWRGLELNILNKIQLFSSLVGNTFLIAKLIKSIAIHSQVG